MFFVSTKLYKQEFVIPLAWGISYGRMIFMGHRIGMCHMMLLQQHMCLKFVEQAECDFAH